METKNPSRLLIALISVWDTHSNIIITGKYNYVIIVAVN